MHTKLPLEGLDHYDVLWSLTQTFHPQSYLEIGVREGGSVCCVLAESHFIISFVKHTLAEGDVLISDDIIMRLQTAFSAHHDITLYLFDNWSYLHGEGGPERVTRLLRDGFYLSNRNWELHNGDSKETVPEFLKTHTDPIDLINVDGDHSVEGATADLENVADRFKVLVMHDLMHPQHGYLKQLFLDYCRHHNYPCFVVGQKVLGVGVAFNL